jgi:probable rRNA maturation factor
MRPSIYFFCEDVRFRAPSIKATRAWLEEVARSEGLSIGSLNYVFCSDAFLSKINLEYLGHNTLTDIITFAIADDFTHIEGEIYISVERVRENAQKYRVSFDKELHRVIVHGLLHLAGYDDKTDRDKKIMRKKETAYLSLGTF